MNIATRPLNDITKEAIMVLNNTIGLASTLRFINQFSTGYGDYTEERKKIFENMELDDIVTEIKQMRTNRKGYRDRDTPHSSPLPHHAAYGSVLRDSADQAESDPGERKPK